MHFAPALLRLGAEVCRLDEGEGGPTCPPFSLLGGRNGDEVAGTRITPELRQELAEIAQARDCELLEAEFVSGTLRLFLDRAEGVRLEDCEAVSRDVSALLDVAEFGSGRYTLEVSSPGLDRKLYGPRDYERFSGRKVRVRFVDPATGRRATVVATLAQWLPEDGGSIVVVGEGQTEPRRIRLEDIQLIRLEMEL